MLLIACANVANLLLVRTDGRRQELAVRAALGAGWGRIARELLLESALLGVAGGALGLALAYGALRVLAAYGPANLPRIHEISIDPSVLAFTLGISLGGGLLFGLIPVFKYARPHLSSALRGGGRSLSASKERHRARSLLVVVQVALALVLMVGSGLMIRTFQALRRVDPGFSGAPGIQTLRISIPEAQVKEPERVLRMEEEILRKIEALPGVSAAAMANALPLEGGSNNSVYAESAAAREGATPATRRYKAVSPGYLRAMGSRLIAGREFTWAETYSQTPVAMVSENMARELWQTPRAALGKHIRLTLKDDWREVVGVVADLRDNGVDQKPPAIAYWPLLQRHGGSSQPGVERSVVFVVRTPRAGSGSLFQELQQAVASVNPNLPLADVKTLESVYDRSLARTSFTLVLLAIAGGMALLLGLVGIYGVISYAVSQRTREIGIRLALGAPLPDVTGLFVRHGLVLSGIGAACGLTAALAMTRLMKSLLFEVSPADPLTYAGVAAGLILAAALASYLPARRATGWIRWRLYARSSVPAVPYMNSMPAITICGMAWFQLSGTLSKASRNGFVSPGAQLPHFRAHDRYALPQYHQAEGVVENTVDLHHLQHAVAGVLNIARNLDHRLLYVALVGLHLGRFGSLSVGRNEPEILHVLFGRAGQRGRGRGWAFGRLVEVQEAGQSGDPHDSDHDRDR